MISEIDIKDMTELQKLKEAKPPCNHIYSRSMHQVYPRKCLNCGATEETK